MSQENIVNFYKTANIENVTLPDNGSFIYDTSDDGFYIVENGEKHKLNTSFNGVLSVEKGGTGVSTIEDLHKLVGVTIIDTEVAISTDEWKGDTTNGFTKEVPVIEILKSDLPIIDVLLNDSAANNRNALASYQCVSKIEVFEDGKLKLTALDTQPSSAFNLKIKIIRNNYTTEATT